MQRWLQQVLNSTASTAHVVRRGGMLVVLASVLVTGTDLCKEKPAPGTSLVVLRSPSDDLVQNRHYHAGQFTNCRPRDYFRVAYKFQQSIHGDRFAQSLFGSDRLQFLGSKFKDGEEMPNNLPTKDETGIYADYFGLAPETNATLVFRPRVQIIGKLQRICLCRIKHIPDKPGNQPGSGNLVLEGSVTRIAILCRLAQLPPAVHNRRIQVNIQTIQNIAQV